MHTPTKKTLPHSSKATPAIITRGRHYNLAALRAIGFSGATLRATFRAGLPAKKLGKQKFVSGDDLCDFLAALPVESARAAK